MVTICLLPRLGALPIFYQFILLFITVYGCLFYQFILLFVGKMWGNSPALLPADYGFMGFRFRFQRW